jgi:hypothetical protein
LLRWYINPAASNMPGSKKSVYGPRSGRRARIGCRNEPVRLRPAGLHANVEMGGDKLALAACAPGSATARIAAGQAGA